MTPQLQKIRHVAQKQRLVICLFACLFCVGLLLLLGLNRYALVRSDVVKLRTELDSLTDLVSSLSVEMNTLHCEVYPVIPHSERVVVQRSGAYCEAQHIAEGAKFDESLAKAIASFIMSFRGADASSPSLGDFGGRIGKYTRYFRDNNISADCYDGAYRIEEITHGFVQEIDLSVPQLHLPKYDWVMCLEVGEHIPASREHFFMQNLDRSSVRGVILSWASKTNEIHVNLKTSAEVIQLAEGYGWAFDPVQTEAFRKAATLGWFKTTVHVFRK